MQKRKVLVIVAGCLLAAAVHAAPKSGILDIALGAATGGTNTTASYTGAYLEELQVLCTDGLSTGEVVVAIVPADTTVAAYSIATNSVADEKRWVPVRDATSVAGADLGSDPPRRYVLAGDSLRLIVTGSPTNKTWRLRSKVSD